MGENLRCEYRKPNGAECGAVASWRVSRLYRKSDAQDSCSRHLAGTASALIEGDTGERAAVTVIPAREVPRG